MNIGLGLGLFLMVISSVSAQGADKGLNGGDMCENRFKVVRDDLAAWIRKGGASGLSLPAGVSLEHYQAAMLEEISKATISCTDDKIFVGSAEKTCKNFVDDRQDAQIVCNAKRFLTETSESDQYILVHHEYAGLAQFERNDGAESRYSISNQISGHLVDQLIKRLAVLPAAPQDIVHVNMGTVEELRLRCQDSVDQAFEDEKQNELNIIRTRLAKTGIAGLQVQSAQANYAYLTIHYPRWNESYAQYTRTKKLNFMIKTAAGVHLTASTYIGLADPVFSIKADNLGRPTSASCFIPSMGTAAYNFKLVNRETGLPIEVIYDNADRSVFGGFSDAKILFRDAPIQRGN